MKTLVLYQVNSLRSVKAQKGQVYPSIEDARKALQDAGFKLHYGISRLSPNEVYFANRPNCLIKAILVK